MDGRAQYPVKFRVRIEAPTCRWTLDAGLEGRWSLGTVARGSSRSIQVKV
jgi:hypothetical protein